MKSENGHKIWQIADRIRSDGETTPSRIIEACVDHGVEINSENLRFILTHFPSRSLSEFTIPFDVTRFMIWIAQKYSPKECWIHQRDLGFWPFMRMSYSIPNR